MLTPNENASLQMYSDFGAAACLYIIRSYPQDHDSARLIVQQTEEVTLYPLSSSLRPGIHKAIIDDESWKNITDEYTKNFATQVSTLAYMEHAIEAAKGRLQVTSALTRTNFRPSNISFAKITEIHKFIKYMEAAHELVVRHRDQHKGIPLPLEDIAQSALHAPATTQKMPTSDDIESIKPYSLAGAAAARQIILGCPCPESHRTESHRIVQFHADLAAPIVDEKTINSAAGMTTVNHPEDRMKSDRTTIVEANVWVLECMRRIIAETQKTIQMNIERLRGEQTADVSSAYTFSLLRGERDFRSYMIAAEELVATHIVEHKEQSLEPKTIIAAARVKLALG
jgi:hypothetical protein